MFYIIKIKSSLNEYSLESCDKDIIQREMDLYFASFFGASNEFKNKILKLEFNHTGTPRNIGANNVKTYEIHNEDISNKTYNQSNIVQDNNLNTRVNKPTESNNFNKADNFIENSATEANASFGADSNLNGNIAIKDNCTEINQAENLQSQYVNQSNKLTMAAAENMNYIGSKTVSTAESFDSNSQNHGIKLYDSNVNTVNTINSDAGIKVSSVNVVNNDNISSGSEYLFKNAKEDAVVQNSKNTEDSIIPTISEDNSEENYDLSSLIHENFQPNLTTSQSQDNPEVIENNNETSDETTDFSFSELAGLQIEIDKNSIANNTQNFTGENNLGQESNNNYTLEKNNINTNLSQNIQTSNSEVNPQINTDSENISNDNAKSISTDNSELNPELKNILNTIENNIELTDINLEHNDENLMDMFKPENNIELARDISSLSQSAPNEDDGLSNYYKPQNESYTKNQQVLDSIFSDNGNTEQIIKQEIKPETDNNQTQNNDKLSNNTEIQQAAPGKIINSNTQVPGQESIQSTNVSQQKTQDLIKPSNISTDTVLDFKIFKAGFIVEEFVDDFLICAYYIKNILRSDSFTMKFINSKLFNATGKFADMSIVNELVVNGYVKEISGEDSMHYCITPEGERYFVSKFQS